jgi:glutamyl-tRNA synthetase
LRPVEEAGHGALRLKELGNVEVVADAARYMGNDLQWAREHKAPIVQWVPMDAARARLVMPDATHLDGLAEPALAREAVGTVVQLERVGFARVDAVGPDGIILWFAHR